MTLVIKNEKQERFDPDKLKNAITRLVERSGATNKISKLEENEFLESIIYRVENRPEIDNLEIYDLVIREANERTTESSPQFSLLSKYTLLKQLYKKVAKNRGYHYGHEYKDYAQFVHDMVEARVYNEELIEAYSFEELEIAGSWLDRAKDELFSYAGLFLLRKNYLAKAPDLTFLIKTGKISEAGRWKNKEILELPQERLLTVALYLMKDENPERRLEYVKEAYWALSSHYIGLATPTLTSAGRPNGTLSSCQILTIDDSLNSIMDVLKDTATFCQNGAGIGIFLGNLRSDQSWIRGYKGSATGVVGPAKLFNEIAQYVNQLNQRKGGIALYLPVDHADILDFLDLRLRTGSQERRAHAIFTAVTLPDEFMRRLKTKQDWTVFDPYEVIEKLGFDLHKLYDKKRLKDGETPNPEDHAYTYHYLIAENADLELKQQIPIGRIYEGIYRARKTGGTPYLYFSDTAARMNPNPHAGMPFCSNLCSEVIQNQSVDLFQPTELDKSNGTVTIMKQGEGLVTCNLSSLVLHNVFTQNVDLQRVTDIQYRMLDNVISLSRVPVEQAEYTNHLYRAVGAGQLGLATLLAEEGIQWDSNEAIEYVDRLFEKIAFANITSSHKLAVEKGSYPLFEGSDWHTGDYFEKRGYNSPEWLELKETVSKGGIRNAYLMATAPTGSNSLIMNGSSSCDPQYDVVYLNKKEGMNVTVVPANYNFRTKRFYKSAFEMDEMWSINIIATAQRHVDQGMSHNMHISRSTSGSELFRLDYGAWDKGMKTIYYTYTRDIEVKDCVFCEG